MVASLGVLRLGASRALQAAKVRIKSSSHLRAVTRGESAVVVAIEARRAGAERLAMRASATRSTRRPPCRPSTSRRVGLRGRSAGIRGRASVTRPKSTRFEDVAECFAEFCGITKQKEMEIVVDVLTNPASGFIDRKLANKYRYAFPFPILDEGSRWPARPSPEACVAGPAVVPPTASPPRPRSLAAADALSHALAESSRSGSSTPRSTSSPLRRTCARRSGARLSRFAASSWPTPPRSPTRSTTTCAPSFRILGRSGSLTWRKFSPQGPPSSASGPTPPSPRSSIGSSMTGTPRSKSWTTSAGPSRPFHSAVVSWDTWHGAG